MAALESSPGRRRWKSQQASAVNGGVALLLVLSLLPPAPARADDHALELSSDVLRVVLPASAFGLTYYYRDAPGRIDFLKSFGATVGTTLGLKLAVSKERPDGSDDDAFPSGHAATAFQGASFIARRYGWKPGAPAYAAASYVAWAQVKIDKHDWSDVLAGAAIGIGFNYLFTRPMDGDVRLNAWIDRSGAGLQVSQRW